MLQLKPNVTTSIPDIFLWVDDKKRFIVTDMETLCSYIVPSTSLVDNLLKYPNEVFMEILGNLEDQYNVMYSEEALSCINQVCDTNRLLF